MSVAAPYRLCPKCKSRRGVEEFVCANEPDGLHCGWDLTNEEIRDGQPDEQQEEEKHHCPNGHTVSAGDLICPECNAELPGEPPTQQIAGWDVLSQLPTDSSVRTRYRVRRPADGREAVLTIYSPGAEPDTTVYDALQKRVPRDHIAELLAFGRWGEQAYDVAEEISGGSLANVVIEPSDTETIYRLVEEIGTALASFMDVGLRHRSLSPDKILIRSRQPLDVVISGFESGRLSELDLDLESPLEVTRYTAPEAIMGGVASASDWWGLGMILLGILTRGECFAGINDQLFLIHVNTNGAPIPAGLEPRLEMLLQGLLTVDRSQRWQWKEVRAWLGGESPPVATRTRSDADSEAGPTITLGGKTYRDARLFAIDASRSANWNEACDLLAHGQIAQWADDLTLDGRAVSALRGLGQRIEPEVGFRLSVALQILNPQLPLIFEEAIVNPAWLLNNPVAGYELISGPIPDLLSQYGLQSDNWLQRLAKRASAIRNRAEALEITLDEPVFQVLVLSTSRARLSAAWESRRRDFPDASNPSLAAILDRRQYSDEDLIILLAATIDQFRSCEEIIHDVDELASRYGLTAPTPEALRAHLTGTRRELHALLDERIAGFARCGHERCDAWADQFRIERRLPLANVLLLLSRAAEEWTKPPHQEYVSSVLEFFEKKITGAILRGQLVRMTLAKTTPRIDVAELAPGLESAAALLENLLQRSDRTFRLDSEIFESPDGPERRMRNLLSRTLQYQRDTGINGTYIGFPFLLRRDASDKSAPRLAPIMLWPVKLVGQVGSRGDFSLAFDSEGREVLLNPAFTGMFGLEGAKSWQELTNDVLLRSAAKLADIVDAFGVKAAPAGRTLQPLPRDLTGLAPGEERCICSAVLFHMEFMGQSLVEDLRQLKQRPSENSAMEPMLRVGTAAPAGGSNSPEPATHISTSDRFLITHSDPSQEEAIARARSTPGLLIQGPPGTGKSQTIVNLVADCIGHRKSVLIVCQKLPALEVVKKRLVAEGLENRLAMVTNVSKDRQPLLRDIREQLDTLTEADAAQAKRNERQANVLATQLEALETQIDAQHHTTAQVDETSGHTYRQMLGDLIALEESMPQPVVDVAGLRRLLASQSAQDVAGLVESCGGIASQWLEAEFEGSPLTATAQFPHDDATLQEFRDVLQAFIGAEDARFRLPAVKSRVLPIHAPDGLTAWLSRYGAFLANMSDGTLITAGTLLPAFRGERHGLAVGRALKAILELERGQKRQALCPESLGPTVAGLSEDHVERLAAFAGEHALLWLAARYEDSPLSVLKPRLSAEADNASFTSGIQEFWAAEQARLAILADSPSAGGLTTQLTSSADLQQRQRLLDVVDPSPLKNWLSANRDRLLQIAESDRQPVSQLLPLFIDSPNGSNYAAVIQNLRNSYEQFPAAFPHCVGLAQLLKDVFLEALPALASRCAEASDAWLEAAIDKVLYESLAVFPRDTSTTVELQRKLNSFADLAKRWIAAYSQQVPGITLDDGEALKSWLQHYGSLVFEAPAALLEATARWHSLFTRHQAKHSPAELLYGGLQKLRSQLQSLQPEKYNPTVLGAIAELPSEQRNDLAEQSSVAAASGLRHALSLKRFRARGFVKRWRRSTGVKARDVSYTNVMQCVECDSGVRRIYDAAVAMLQPTGVSLEWQGWKKLDADLSRLIDLFPRVHKIRGAVQRCPCSFAKDRLLAAASDSTFRKFGAAIQSLLRTHELNQDCRKALAALTKDMSVAWLAAREADLARDPKLIDAASFYGDLTSALPQLNRLQALRERVAGFDQTALKVLGRLSPARDWIQAITPEERAKHVEALINRHALHAHKHAIETTHGIPAADWIAEAASLPGLCETIENTKHLMAALTTCPARPELEPALRSGSRPELESVLSLFHSSVQYAEARIRSVNALHSLQPWMDSQWIAECSSAVVSGSATDRLVKPLVDALPSVARYQEFRNVLAKADPFTPKVFAAFASMRKGLESIPHEDVGHEVRRGILLAKALQSKVEITNACHELSRLRADTPEEIIVALDALADAARLAEALDGCPLANSLFAAVASGSADATQALIAEFGRLDERSQAMTRSRSCLADLASWMQPQWIATCEHGLAAGEDLRPRFQALLDASQRLRAYQLFRARSSQLPAIALQAFEHLSKHRDALRNLTEKGDSISIGDLIRQVLRREALLGWKNRLETAEPALLSDGQEIAAKITQLAKLDASLQDLNRKRLANDVPMSDVSEPSAWTDITRLTGPRAVRLREFFIRGQDMGLLSLRPVWLTTPDVASQLLPLTKSLFDVVVFDEASQMPVEYALPCLYRARTTVVSGDDKQMPPSSFFASRIESDEAEIFDGEVPDDAATDQERDAFEQAWNRREIKDCPDLLNLGDAVLRRSTLQVHYRSAYRELIGYSNAAFYRNELGVPVRHPDEAVRAAKPIEYLHVGGTYSHQTNPDEARTVVDLLADLWLTPSEKRLSVGVVTFNLKQAELIVEHLDARADIDEAFRDAYAREQARLDHGEDMSVFVKNVENVQGDERDLIIFSTTFGPTSEGLFRRAFGVLGQKGGERRLNVAVTRARRKVIIVSSMPVDEVSDMLRTLRKPETPRDYLQAYLHYARLVSEGQLDESRRLAGRLVTAGRITETSRTTDDGFLNSVASFVRSLGHEPVNTANDPILGVDFSISDPATGLFGVGIECDAPRHRLTQRARARELWRPSVLRRAYRVVHRVSPYAWYHDGDGERERLRRVIFETLGQPQSRTSSTEATAL